MDKTLFILFLFMAPAFMSAQKDFPELNGITLNDTEIVIPKDTEGKLVVLGMAYSKKAESTLKTWYTPMYDKFVLKRGIMDELYDVHFFFVPMYTGAKKAALNVSMKEMKESNRKDLFPYLLFYKGEIDPFKEQLGMDKKELPYLFILDEAGKVLYKTKGLYSEAKMEEIEEVLQTRW